MLAMRLRNTARTLRNEVAQCGFDAARAHRQPDTARTSVMVFSLQNGGG